MSVERQAAARSEAPDPVAQYRQCGVPGCVKPHQARGMCMSHYAKARRRRLGEEYTRLLQAAAEGRPYIPNTTKET